MFRFAPWVRGLMISLNLFSINSFAQVKINEVVYDDYGDPDDSTYVELFGPVGLSLPGYQIVGVNGSNGEEYVIIDLVGSIPSDGFFVIGQSANIANVDLISDLIDLQNGPDNILLKANSITMDALGYGAFGSAVFVGEGQPAPDQTVGTSLCRFPDGHDTQNNADDFALTPYLTPGTPNILPGQAAYYTLYDLRHNPPPPDEIFWTSGIANVNSNLFGGSFVINAFMQDAQAGINLYGGSFSFTLSDCLWVKARLDDYNGLLELMPIFELNVGDSVILPDPRVLDCATANSQGEDSESMLVRLNGVWITAPSPAWPAVGQDANLTITDNTGLSLVMRIDKDTELDGWAGHPGVGEPFDLIGILSQYGAYQVWPRYASDFLPSSSVFPGAAPSPGSFEMMGAHPNPFNACVTIHFNLAAPERIAMEIFNLDGRCIERLAAGIFPPGEQCLRWDASELPSGIYLVRLSTATNSQTAKVLLLR